MSKLEQDIEHLKKEIASKQEQLKLQQEELVRLSPVHKLAIAIHDATCYTNHTDGCSWYYEIKNSRHEWSGHAHARALDQAKAVQISCDDVNISSMIKIVECLK